MNDILNALKNITFGDLFDLIPEQKSFLDSLKEVFDVIGEVLGMLKGII